MEWDLSERESITTARWLVASPEYVYEQLAYYGTNSKTKSFVSKKETEEALLKRNDPLINLGLAKYCSEDDVLYSLYTSASPENISGEYEEYYKGLRTACLSNQIEIFSKWRKFNFSKLVKSASEEISNYIADTNSKRFGSTAELYAFLENPTVDDDLLASLFAKTGLFEAVDLRVWVHMVGAASRNLRLMKDDSNEWGPDMGAYSIQEGVCGFLEKVPISTASYYLVSDMLAYLDTSSFHKPKNAKLIIERWLGSDVLKPEVREELACKLSALLGGDKLVSNKLSAKFQNSKLQKIIRFSNYGNKFLSLKEINKALNLDGQLFLECAVMNNNMLEYDNMRVVLEKNMNSSVAYAYLKRLENINKISGKNKLFPITQDFYTEHEISIDQNPEIIFFENKLSKLEKDIIYKVDASDKKTLILFVVVIFLLFLMWK
jgi:hypothetical protein